MRRKAGTMSKYLKKAEILPRGLSRSDYQLKNMKSMSLIKNFNVKDKSHLLRNIDSTLQSNSRADFDRKLRNFMENKSFQSKKIFQRPVYLKKKTYLFDCNGSRKKGDEIIEMSFTQFTLDNLYLQARRLAQVNDKRSRQMVKESVVNLLKNKSKKNLIIY